MNIFFDLDGTLIDSKLRLFNLFQFIVKNSTLTFEQYWDFKQKKISNEDILTAEFGYSRHECQEFVTQWMLLIEHTDFLKFDNLLDGIEEKLQELEKNATLYVCTARQYEAPVIVQLNELGIRKYFKKVFVTQQKLSKTNLISENVTNYTPLDWFIGDTGHDINTGKELDMNTCAVTSGFLSHQVLVDYNPDLIVKSVAEFSI